MKSDKVIKPTINSKEKTMKSDKVIKPTINSKEKSMKSDNVIKPTINSKEKSMNSDNTNKLTLEPKSELLKTTPAKFNFNKKYGKILDETIYEGIVIEWVVEEDGAIKFSSHIGSYREKLSSRDLYRRKLKSSNIDHRFISPFKDSGQAYFGRNFASTPLYIIVGKNVEGDIVIKEMYGNKEYAEAISKSMNASYKLQSSLWELYELNGKKSATTSWKVEHKEILYTFPENFKPLLDANLEITPVEVYEVENPYKYIE